MWNDPADEWNNLTMERNDRIPKRLMLNVIIMFGGILRTDIAQKIVVPLITVHLQNARRIGVRV